MKFIKIATLFVTVLIMSSFLIISAAAKSPCADHTYKAEKLIDQGKWKQALSIAKAAVADCSKQSGKIGARPYVTLGMIYNHFENYKAAAKQYERAIKEQPKLGLAYYSLGGIYTNLSQYDKAIKVLKKGLKIKMGKSDKAKAYYNLGYAYFSRAADKNDTSDRRCEQWFKKSMKLDPGIGENHFYLGVMQELSYKDFDKAIAYYGKGCSMANKSSCTWKMKLQAKMRAQTAPTREVAQKTYAYTKQEEAMFRKIQSAYQKKGIDAENSKKMAGTLRQSLKTIQPKYRKTTLERTLQSLSQ